MPSSRRWSRRLPPGGVVLGAGGAAHDAQACAGAWSGRGSGGPAGGAGDSLSARSRLQDGLDVVRIAVRSIEAAELVAGVLDANERG